MAKQRTSVEDIPQPKVADGPWEGLSPSQRKAMATGRLAELRATPSEAQKRAAEEDVLLAEISRAEREEAEYSTEAMTPRIRELTAFYALAQRNVEPRFITALSAMREAARQAVEAEAALRKAQDVLARQIEGRCRIRLEQGSLGKTPGQVRELHQNLLLEGSTEFRQRWKALAEDIGAKPLLAGIDPGEDALANGLLLAVQQHINREIGGRPAHFSSSRTRGMP